MNSKLVEKIDKYHSMTREELAEEFNCKPSEICIGDYIARDTGDKVCPYKVITGFANFEGSDVESLGKLEVVIGKKLHNAQGDFTDMKKYPIYYAFNIRGSKITDLGNLRIVYGTFGINNEIKSLKNLTFLGSNLNINNSNLRDLGNLEVVEGMLSLLDDSKPCHVTSLGKLRHVRRLVINSASLMDFGDLKEAKHISFGPNRNEELFELFNKEFAYIKKRGNKNKAQRIETDETVTI